MTNDSNQFNMKCHSIDDVMDHYSHWNENDVRAKEKDFSECSTSNLKRTNKRWGERERRRELSTIHSWRNKEKFKQTISVLLLTNEQMRGEKNQVHINTSNKTCEQSDEMN